MESRDDQRRGGGNPAPATTYIILSRSGAGYLGSYEKESFEAANLLLHATVDKRLLSALRWFRLGILADTSEEQFQKFWFSLELLAQYKKTTEKVHDSCPKCFGALYCKTCDTYPVHRPYPRQAIESIWKALAPHEVELFQIVNRARNAMLHGEPPDVIEAMTGVPLHQLVDPLSKVTWKGLISEVAAALPREKRPCHLNLGVANTFVKWNLTSAVHVDANIPLGPNGTPDIELLTGISVTFGDD